jgi:hypothetical protein
MSLLIQRIDHLSERDKLWELYLHTLAGIHGNIGANDRGDTAIAKRAMTAAMTALRVWEGRNE